MEQKTTLNLTAEHLKIKAWCEERNERAREELKNKHGETITAQDIINNCEGSA